MRPWMPTKELEKHRRARIALGVLKHPDHEITPGLYESLFLDKLETAVRQTPDWKEAAETYLRPIHRLLDADPEPEDVAALLMEEEAVYHPVHLIKMHLQNREGSLKELMEWMEEDPEPVSKKKFQEELNSLDLWTFLETLTIY